MLIIINYFKYFLTVSIISFISKPDSSWCLTIFLIFCISSFMIIRAVIPNPKYFFWIAASVADTPVVILNSTKTLLADGVGIFFVHGNLTDINGLRKLRHPSF